MRSLDLVSWPILILRSRLAGELASKQWRIGLMGSSSNAVNINRCLSAFEVVLAS